MYSLGGDTILRVILTWILGTYLAFMMCLPSCLAMLQFHRKIQNKAHQQQMTSCIINSIARAHTPKIYYVAVDDDADPVWPIFHSSLFSSPNETRSGKNQTGPDTAYTRAILDIKIIYVTSLCKSQHLYWWNMIWGFAYLAISL